VVIWKQASISNGFRIPRYSVANVAQWLKWPWYDQRSWSLILVPIDFSYTTVHYLHSPHAGEWSLQSVFILLDYVSIYRVAQKSKPQSFVHIFVKYWPIVKFFHWRILWNICNKVVTKHTTTPLLCRYTTLWNIKYVKPITIWWIYEQSLGLNFWPILYDSIVFLCLQTQKVYLQQNII